MNRPQFMWPAEWEQHAATWLAWPQNPATWPGRLEQARAAFAVFVRELTYRERVELLVADAAMAESARAAIATAGADLDRLRLHRVPTDDAWLRDSGPLFVRRADGSPALLDFPFDAWGGKYLPWERDAAVPQALSAITGLPRFAADFVLEAGAIDGNGAGTVLTTESCLLHPNRGAGRTRAAMEERLVRWLGARQVLWLGGGIAGDDTDGHVDNIARFVHEQTVVAAVCEDESDPNFAPLSENLRRLRGMRDAAGKPLAIATLPMPPALEIGGQRCPASYANFCFANGCLLVPTFGAAEDERALAILSELLPGRDIVPVPAAGLVLGLGALHCLSQHQPA